jgi:hypothetical protein
LVPIMLGLMASRSPLTMKRWNASFVYGEAFSAFGPYSRTALLSLSVNSGCPPGGAYNRHSPSSY